MALPSSTALQPLDEDAQAILVAADLLDVVAQVRPDDARAHDGEVTAERRRDLRRRGGRRSGGHAEHRRVAERLERAADEEIVRPEVVAPHADAVHLVDHDEADADRPQRLDERGVAEPLGRGVEESRAALGDVADPVRRHLVVERRVDERRRRGDLGRQLVDLVLHQRDERREDERRLRPAASRRAGRSATCPSPSASGRACRGPRRPRARPPPDRAGRRRTRRAPAAAACRSVMRTSVRAESERLRAGALACGSRRGSDGVGRHRRRLRRRADAAVRLDRHRHDRARGHGLRESERRRDRRSGRRRRPRPACCP